MNLTVTINSVDKTSSIDWSTFTREDVLNAQIDTCNFDVKKYGSKTWRPNVGDTVVVTDGATKIFGGVIIQTDEEMEGLAIKYRVQCKDYSHELDRLLVLENYTNKTVNEIITDINTNYLTGFTVTNVACDVFVSSITFDRLPASRCLQILAEKTNYSWYIDYDKDIHFFAKNSEAAPFDLTDTNDKYDFASLVIKNDLSQIKNKIYVRGGETPIAARDENFTGDGTKKTFALAYKFSAKPTVTVGGVSKTVGIDNLDSDGSYDCMWNYNEKYIRFISAPAGAAAIVVNGVPLMPILVQVQDDASIATYGTYEYSIIDKKIRTNDEARLYGYSQLTAYASQINEGGFTTGVSGLKSGQSIYIQSDIRNLSESFLIQRVGLQMLSQTEGKWTVELASLRTISIIEFLQKLLLNQDKQSAIAENEVVVLEMSKTDYQTVNVTEEIAPVTPKQDYQTANCTEDISKDPLGAGVAPDFVLAPYFPSGHTDTKREGLLDISLKFY